MPWSPPQDEEYAADPRLDRFRERAGVLVDGSGEEVGGIFLTVEPHWVRASGHLWWSRWGAPQEVVHGYLILREGSFIDWISTGETLEQELADWEADVFRHAGRQYAVVWQGEEESARLRRDVFRLD